MLAWGAGAAPAAPPAGWDYEVRFDAGLDRAHVRLCFRRFVPKRLVTAHADAHAAYDLTPVPGHASLTRQANGAGYVANGLKPGGCLAWSVDVDELCRSTRWRRPASRVGKDLVVAPGALLLRPALWTSRMHVTVRFVLPQGQHAAVPWPPTRDGRGYLLDRFALRLESSVAFGRFTVEPVRAAGAVLNVAVLDASHRASPAGIRTWLTRAAEAIAQLNGRFPEKRVLVVVQPVPARHPPVIFGTAMRGGGAHVKLMLSSGAKDEELVGEWVGVHEMTHLAMPWTYDTEAWFQEGFATYYQEVLRARAGLLTERDAWQNIHDGFARGRRSGGERTLAAESRHMHRHHTYHRVYWAGAAIALLLDVELRRRFPRRWCLDDLMHLWGKLHGGTRGGAVTAAGLMRAADRRIGKAVCASLVGRHLARETFPDLTPTYGLLGLGVDKGLIRLDDDAPQAAIRRAIMSPKPTPSPRNR